MTNLSQVMLCNKHHLQGLPSCAFFEASLPFLCTSSQNAADSSDGQGTLEAELLHHGEPSMGPGRD